MYELVMRCWPLFELHLSTGCVWSHMSLGWKLNPPWTSSFHSLCVILYELRWDADPPPQEVCDILALTWDGMLMPPRTLSFHSLCVISLYKLRLRYWCYMGLVLPQFVCDHVIWVGGGMLTPCWTMSFHSECVILSYELVMGCWHCLELLPSTVCAGTCCMSLVVADPTFHFVLLQRVCDLVRWACHGMLTPPGTLSFFSECVISSYKPAMGCWP